MQTGACVFEPTDGAVKVVEFESKTSGVQPFLFEAMFGLGYKFGLISDSK